MTNGELRDSLTNEGFRYYRDDEYNRDIFIKNNLLVDGVETKLEVLVDYYSVKVRWWKESHKHVSICDYLSKLDWESLKIKTRNLIEENKSRIKKFTAWSDGSGDWFHPEKPGGSAYIIINSDGTEFKRASKGFLHTTSNRMELLAIVSIVNSLPYNSEVTIYSDSQYCQRALYGQNPQKNLDQIQLYHNIVREKQLNVRIKWIKGHNGDKYNEECDQMAKAEYEKMAGGYKRPKANPHSSDTTVVSVDNIKSRKKRTKKVKQ